MTAPAWCGRYVGLPHEFGARGPIAYDCWGIVHAALRDHFGVHVPELTGAEVWEIHDRLARGHALTDEAFDRVTDPEPGDVLTFDLGHQHVGLVVCPEFMLHALASRGVALARWHRQPWRGARVGCYRPKAARHA